MGINELSLRLARGSCEGKHELSRFLSNSWNWSCTFIFKVSLLSQNIRNVMDAKMTWSDSLAGIREQAPLKMNVRLTQSLWILWRQSQLPFFNRILSLFVRPIIPLRHSLEPQNFILNSIYFPINYSLPFLNLFFHYSCILSFLKLYLVLNFYEGKIKANGFYYEFFF